MGPPRYSRKKLLKIFHPIVCPVQKSVFWGLGYSCLLGGSFQPPASRKGEWEGTPPVEILSPSAACTLWLPFFHLSGSSSLGTNCKPLGTGARPGFLSCSFLYVSSLGSSFKTTASVFLLTFPAWISRSSDLHSH